MSNLKVGNVIGAGLVFPLELSGGKVVIKEGFPLIESSLKCLMSWLIGTRYFLGEFGTTLERLLGEPNDLILQSLIEHGLIEAITRWETRIELIEAKIVRPDDITIHIILSYRIISTQLESSFIFPYYTNIKY